MAEPTPASPGDEESAVDALRRLLQQGQAQEAPETPMEYRFLDEKLKLQEIELKREHARQDIGLRQTYARGLLALLGLQLVAANVIFWVYAEVGKHWQLPSDVIQIWLAATVVQMVGVVTVVTRYLFPPRDKATQGPSSA
jgi:hypothetical protein